MNTDYYNIRKHSTSSSNSSKSNYSTPSCNSSKTNYSINSNNNNNTRLNDYTFCYNLCCFCSPSRKKIKTEKTFVI